MGHSFRPKKDLLPQAFLDGGVAPGGFAVNRLWIVVPAMLLSLVVAASLTSCGDSGSLPAVRPSENLETVEFALDWAGPEYIGYYAARAMGYYADAGLNVKLLPGAGSAASSAGMLEGSIPFGTVSASALVREIVKRAGPGAELPDSLPVIKAIVFPNSPSVILTSSQLRISTVQDLAGLKVGYPSEVSEAYQQFQELLGAHPGLREQIVFREDMIQVVQQLKTGSIDALLTYMMDAPPTLELDDFDYHAVLYSDLGLNVPSQCIVVDPAASVDPEMLRKFMEASIDGWEYVRRNPETAARLFDKELPGQPENKTAIVARYTVDFLPPARPADPLATYTDREARASAIHAATDAVLTAEGFAWSEAQREELVQALLGDQPSP